MIMTTYFCLLNAQILIITDLCKDNYQFLYIENAVTKYMHIVNEIKRSRIRGYEVVFDNLALAFFSPPFIKQITNNDAVNRTQFRIKEKEKGIY